MIVFREVRMLGFLFSVERAWGLLWRIRRKGPMPRSGMMAAIWNSRG